MGKNTPMSLGSIRADSRRCPNYEGQSKIGMNPGRGRGTMGI
jgi:hypothetical protein